jgi:alpha-tubulin suppressor-like RCC1 family protein
MRYQWTRNQVAIAGATTAGYTTPVLTVSDNGAVYAVVVYNGAGVAISQSVVLTVGPMVAPGFASPPSDQSVTAPATATFMVAASGAPTPTLQWQVSTNAGTTWIDISGATQSSYTTPATVVANNGLQYRVVANSSAGTAISSTATLSINSATPAATAPPATGKISLGQFHTCAVKADSTVACWGHNSSHEVTSGPVNPSVPEPVVVAGLTGITQVAAGYQRSCAIGNLGSIWCWGGAMTTPTPLKDSNGADVLGAKVLAMGYVHNCFIDAGTTVRCWGDNSGNQLGQGAASAYTSPVVVQTATGPLTDVVSLAAGDFHTCALKSNGDVVCWGQGPIGDGTESAPRAVALAVTGATAIGSGAGHVCAAITTGGVKCWGANGNGQLGNMNTTSQLFPVNVADFAGLLSGVTVIAAESKNTCAIPASGRVVCWGAVFPDALNGTNTYSPTEKGNLSLQVIAMASNWNHSCVLVTDGSMECWGSDAYGQLGNGISLVPSSGGGPFPPDTSVVGGAIFWH